MNEIKQASTNIASDVMAWLKHASDNATRANTTSIVVKLDVAPASQDGETGFNFRLVSVQSVDSADTAEISATDARALPLLTLLGIASDAALSELLFMQVPANAPGQIDPA